MNVKCQNPKVSRVELRILFELDSPSVHHFVRALSFEICGLNHVSFPD